MATIKKLSLATLEEIAKVLGHTTEGFTGPELARLLSECKIRDPGEMTKWKRLLEALRSRQEEEGYGTSVLTFVRTAMAPVRYSSSPQLFEHRRDQLNKILAFEGFTINSEGQLLRAEVAKTLDQASRRASRLREELLRRTVHSDILRFCRAELLHENYFHAVFEASKSVADKIREKSGLTSDGASLIDDAFGLGSGLPRLAFNSLSTETETSEHKGLANLMKGLFGTFRNTTAHAPKIKWPITEQDALDMLSLTSLIHRRLDDAVPTGR